MSIVKKEAIKIISRLPDKATWDDLMYELYVKQKISIGLTAAAKGQVLSHSKVKAKFASK